MYYGMPKLRVRFPVLGGRLVPYAIGGVGMSYMEVKDRKPLGRDLGIRGSNVTVVGALGGGLDSMVATNIALGFEVEYMFSRGHQITVADGRPKTSTSTPC